MMHVDDLLLPWFQEHKRDLPWRGTRDPYAIWVSEIMLQQTQVDTVIPYYERFMSRFPTVQALARADLSDVLKQWEGLGYYARARNLHRAAQEVASGGMPSSLSAIQKLPGIGRYTAGAIASMAWGVPAPVLDGNVRRVLSRLYGESGDPKRLWVKAEELMGEGDPSLHNQALMELGALVCTPRAPQCPVCPIRTLCTAFRVGTPEAFPHPKVRKPTPHHQVAVGAIHDAEGRLLIALRPPKGLLGGLWELPGGKMEPHEAVEDALLREAREELGVELRVTSPLISVDHAYSHFKVTLHTRVCRIVRGTPRPLSSQELRWVRADELDGFAFPAATHRILAAWRRYLVDLPRDKVPFEPG